MGVLRVQLTGWLCLSAVFCSGCGDGGVAVTGQVTREGGPVEPQGGRVIKVSFVPRDPSSDASADAAAKRRERAGLTTTVNRDGSFRLPQVAPGSYQLRVSDFARYPSQDRLAEHFREHPGNIMVTVPAGASEHAVSVELKDRWYRAE